MSFAEWKALVDECIAELFFGMTSEQLPDVDYIGMYRSGMSPADAANAAIDHN